MSNNKTKLTIMVDGQVLYSAHYDSELIKRLMDALDVNIYGKWEDACENSRYAMISDVVKAVFVTKE